MDEARTRFFGPTIAPDSASDRMSSDLRDNVFLPYPDEYNGDDWNVADMPANPPLNVGLFFAETLTQLASFAAQLSWPYLRKLAACLALHCKT